MKNSPVMTASILTLIGLGAMAGCAGPIDHTLPERSKTITQGVYGLLTQEGEGSGERALAASVEIYDRNPIDARLTVTDRTAQAQSDGNGFYQLALEPGSYWICHRPSAVSEEPGACASFVVVAGQAIRRDYVGGFAQSWTVGNVSTLPPADGSSQGDAADGTGG